MTEPRLTVCPECGKEELHRLIGTGSGIIFKGSGFYETDYKKKTPPPSESKADSKTESKNETQAPSAPSIDSKKDSKPISKDQTSVTP
jgi:predicted nucleic acid-binding Zn ribbon protein